MDLLMTRIFKGAVNWIYVLFDKNVITNVPAALGGVHCITFTYAFLYLLWCFTLVDIHYDKIK